MSGTVLHGPEDLRSIAYQTELGPGCGRSGGEALWSTGRGSGFSARGYPPNAIPSHREMKVSLPLKTECCWVGSHAYSADSTSAPARVPMAVSTAGPVVSFRKRTEPSANEAFAPPEWKE